MDFFMPDEFTHRKKNPLSVILERSGEDGTVFNVSGESRLDVQNHEDRIGSGILVCKQQQPDISDSDFCSSNQGINMLAQDEAERLQFVNSNAESFFDRADDIENSTSRLNGTNKGIDESIGSYFIRKSSHPNNELETSQFQKTCDGTEWPETSGFRQGKPCDTSTPKPIRNTSRGISMCRFTLSTSAIHDESYQNSHVTGQNTSGTSVDMNRSSVVQLLHDTNGSISSMAKFFNGPDAIGMGKESMLAHVLEYCHAKSVMETSSVVDASFLDTSRYSSFRENLQQDSESSATSKNSNSSQDSPNDTIQAEMSLTEHTIQETNKTTVSAKGKENILVVPGPSHEPVSNAIKISATSVLASSSIEQSFVPKPRISSKYELPITSVPRKSLHPTSQTMLVEGGKISVPTVAEKPDCTSIISKLNVIELSKVQQTRKPTPVRPNQPEVSEELVHARMNSRHVKCQSQAGLPISQIKKNESHRLPRSKEPKTENYQSKHVTRMEDSNQFNGTSATKPDSTTGHLARKDSEIHNYQMPSMTAGVAGLDIGSNVPVSGNSMPFSWNIPQDHALGVPIGVSENKFPMYGFPFVIQIQCPFHHAHQQCGSKSTTESMSEVGCSQAYSHPNSSNPTSTLRAHQSRGPEISNKINNNTATPLLDNTPWSQEIPNIKVDKALVGFSSTPIGKLKSKHLTIHNLSNFQVFVKCGVQKSSDQCFWNILEEETSKLKCEVGYTIAAFDQKTISLGFLPNKEGQVIGSLVLKFNRADGVSANEVVYRTQIQLTGFGVPGRCSKRRPI